MSELTPEARVWVAPDAYDNPTLWTDGPTPDFPRALLVRVPSNADLFDWIAARADAPKPDEAVSIYDPSLYGDRKPVVPKPGDEKGQADG